MSRETTLPVITGGVYLVVDPAAAQPVLLEKLKAALDGGINIVQIWNNWGKDADKISRIESICQLCTAYHVSVLINEEWQLLKEVPALCGVHFDSIPVNFGEIKAALKKPFLAGITCTNNLENVHWAIKHRLDYISFCAMFPSQSAGNCEIVMSATVKKAKSLTNIPVFISGGVTPDNMKLLQEKIDFNGVAVISGILSDKDPKYKAQQYHAVLHN